MISQKELMEELNYDEMTGWFTRKFSRTPTVTVGERAGSVNGQGYRQVLVNGKYIQEHTLAWLYVYGNLPKNQIDHINHNKEDNSIANLRDVTHSQNVLNKPMYSNNKSGHTGVIWESDRKKWSAYIKEGGVRKRIGSYLDKSEAISARQAASISCGYHTNHGVIS